MMKNEIASAKPAQPKMYPRIIREFDDSDEPMLYRG